MIVKLAHPAISHVTDIIEDEKKLFIVCEYIEGIALESIVQNNGA